MRTLPGLHKTVETPSLRTTAQKTTPENGFPPDPLSSGGGGGSRTFNTIKDLELVNQQSINHNHCPLDDCEPYTEHKFPEAVAGHVEHFFEFIGAKKALNRYGPDIMNKAVAIMETKIVRENFMPDSLGGFFRKQCEIMLQEGSNVATGKDRDRMRERLKQPKTCKPADHGQKYLDEYKQRRGG
jgi:hypothetical protein